MSDEPDERERERARHAWLLDDKPRVLHCPRMSGYQAWRRLVAEMASLGRRK